MLIHLVGSVFCGRFAAGNSLIAYSLAGPLPHKAGPPGAERGFPCLLAEVSALPTPVSVLQRSHDEMGITTGPAPFLLVS